MTPKFPFMDELGRVGVLVWMAPELYERVLREAERTCRTVSTVVRDCVSAGSGRRAPGGRQADVA